MLDPTGNHAMHTGLEHEHASALKHHAQLSPATGPSPRSSSGNSSITSSGASGSAAVGHALLLHAHPLVGLEQPAHNQMYERGLSEAGKCEATEVVGGIYDDSYDFDDDGSHLQGGRLSPVDSMPSPLWDISIPTPGSVTNTGTPKPLPWEFPTVAQHQTAGSSSWAHASTGGGSAPGTTAGGGPPSSSYVTAMSEPHSSATSFTTARQVTRDSQVPGSGHTGTPHDASVGPSLQVSTAGAAPGGEYVASAHAVAPTYRDSCSGTVDNRTQHAPPDLWAAQFGIAAGDSEASLNHPAEVLMAPGVTSGNDSALEAADMTSVTTAGGQPANAEGKTATDSLFARLEAELDDIERSFVQGLHASGSSGGSSTGAGSSGGGGRPRSRPGSSCGQGSLGAAPSVAVTADMLIVTQGGTGEQRLQARLSSRASSNGSTGSEGGGQEVARRRRSYTAAGVAASPQPCTSASNSSSILDVVVEGLTGHQPSSAPAQGVSVPPLLLRPPSSGRRTTTEAAVTAALSVATAALSSPRAELALIAAADQLATWSPGQQRHLGGSGVAPGGGSTGGITGLGAMAGVGAGSSAHSSPTKHSLTDLAFELGAWDEEQGPGDQHKGDTAGERLSSGHLAAVGAGRSSIHGAPLGSSHQQQQHSQAHGLSGSGGGAVSRKASTSGAAGGRGPQRSPSLAELLAAELLGDGASGGGASGDQQAQSTAEPATAAVGQGQHSQSSCEGAASSGGGPATSLLLDQITRAQAQLEQLLQQHGSGEQESIELTALVAAAANSSTTISADGEPAAAVAAAFSSTPEAAQVAAHVALSHQGSQASSNGRRSGGAASEAETWVYDNEGGVAATAMNNTLSVNPLFRQTSDHRPTTDSTSAMHTGVSDQPKYGRSSSTGLRQESSGMSHSAEAPAVEQAPPTHSEGGGHTSSQGSHASSGDGNASRKGLPMYAVQRRMGASLEAMLAIQRKHAQRMTPATAVQPAIKPVVPPLPLRPATSSAAGATSFQAANLTPASVSAGGSRSQRAKSAGASDPAPATGAVHTRAAAQARLQGANNSQHSTHQALQPAPAHGHAFVRVASRTQSQQQQQHTRGKAAHQEGQLGAHISHVLAQDSTPAGGSAEQWAPAPVPGFEHPSFQHPGGYPGLAGQILSMMQSPRKNTSPLLSGHVADEEQPQGQAQARAGLPAHAPDAGPTLQDPAEALGTASHLLDRFQEYLQQAQERAQAGVLQAAAGPTEPARTSLARQSSHHNQAPQLPPALRPAGSAATAPTISTLTPTRPKAASYTAPERVTVSALGHPVRPTSLSLSPAPASAGRRYSRRTSPAGAQFTTTATRRQLQLQPPVLPLTLIPLAGSTNALQQPSARHQPVFTSAPEPSMPAVTGQLSGSIDVPPAWHPGTTYHDQSSATGQLTTSSKGLALPPSLPPSPCPVAPAFAPLATLTPGGRGASRGMKSILAALTSPKHAPIEVLTAAAAALGHTPSITHTPARQPATPGAKHAAGTPPNIRPPSPAKAATSPIALGVGHHTTHEGIPGVFVPLPYGSLRTATPAVAVAAVPAVLTTPGRQLHQQLLLPLGSPSARHVGPVPTFLASASSPLKTAPLASLPAAALSPARAVPVAVAAAAPDLQLGAALGDSCVLQSLVHQLLGMQRTRQAAESAEAVCALLAPGNGLESRMAQALDEGEAGELRGLTTLVEQRQVLSPVERMHVWGKVESLLAAKLPPPPLPPGSPRASASPSPSATPGRQGRYSPGVTSGLHESEGGHTVTHVTPTESRPSPAAEEGRGHTAPSPPLVHQQHTSEDVQPALQVAVSISGGEDLAAAEEQGTNESSPAQTLQHTNPLYNAFTTSAGSLHNTGGGGAVLTASPGSPGGAQGSVMDEVSEAVIGETMSRVHRAVAPNATLALAMDLEWRELRTQQAVRASLESVGLPPGSVPSSRAGSPC